MKRHQNITEDNTILALQTPQLFYFTLSAFLKSIDFSNLMLFLWFILPTDCTHQMQDTAL